MKGWRHELLLCATRTPRLPKMFSRPIAMLVILENDVTVRSFGQLLEYEVRNHDTVGRVSKRLTDDIWCLDHTKNMPSLSKISNRPPCSDHAVAAIGLATKRVCGLDIHYST